MVIFWTLNVKNISTPPLSDSGRHNSSSYGSNSNLSSSFNSGLNTVGLNNGYQNGGLTGGLSSSKWGNHGSSWNGNTNFEYLLVKFIYI